MIFKLAKHIDAKWFDEVCYGVKVSALPGVGFVKLLIELCAAIYDEFIWYWDHKVIPAPC